MSRQKLFLGADGLLGILPLFCEEVLPVIMNRLSCSIIRTSPTRYNVTDITEQTQPRGKTSFGGSSSGRH